MFTCKLCDRSYQSQSSLSRHSRNHTIDHSRHVCSACDVIFSRRDLLLRHMQIHRESGGDTTRPVAREKSRRRCHTACQPCRRARVKCHGGQPCLTCTLNQRECRYTSRSSLRVSRLSQNGDEAEGPGQEQIEVPHGDLHWHPLEPAEAATLPLTPEDLPQTASFDVAMDSTGVDSTSVDLGILSFDDEGGLPWAAGSTPAAMSWPWMHETLYMQGNPCEEWLAANSGAGQNATRQTTLPPANTALPFLPDSQEGDDSNMAPLALSSLTVEPRLGFPNPHTTGANTPPTAVSSADVQTSDRTPPTHGCEASQRRVIQDLVAYATKPVLEAGPSRLCYWTSLSLQVVHTFAIEDWQSKAAEPVLLRMLNLYRQHFSPLWPLLSDRELSTGHHIHPLLFLTLVSIGAMYGSPAERRFGTALHDEMRDVLLTHQVLHSPEIRMEDAEESPLSLGRARLLTQVSALYFGQRRAFSYAQHLGAILIAQARRMDLFYPPMHATTFSPSSSVEEQMDAWHRHEARKRLAFGILRVDVYTSVLMSSRPLLSAEEIDLALPASDQLWNTIAGLSAEEIIDRINADPGHSQRFPFADLVRIAMDRSEALPDMEPTSYELLLFGMQEPVWRFSHDPHLFRRLTGHHPISNPNDLHASSGISITTITTISPEPDPLGIVHRRMNDLKSHHQQLTAALQKWEQTFVSVRTTGRYPNERTSIMSSLLLLHQSRLRLAAPLPDLHRTAYTVSISVSSSNRKEKEIEHRTLSNLTRWARSPAARTAADIACQIWALIDHETQRAVESTDRARHNLLAFSGLHHAAVVLWVFAGCREHEHGHEAGGDSDVRLPVSTGEEAIVLCRGQSSRLMRRIIRTYMALVPTGWCSFAAAAEQLSLSCFPVTM